MRKSAVFVFFVLLATITMAQEVLLPPGINQVLAGTQKEPHLKIKAGTLQMPFLEDFSHTFIYPDASRFSDSMAFIGSSFAIQPVSIGVATLDGLDEYGYLYAHGSSFAFGADTLTSLAIRTDSVFTGTPHASTPADSIYFSFFYQPQGYGEMPDPDDSLYLDFFNATSGEWQQVWSVEGMSYNSFLALHGQPWKCIMIALTDPVYLDGNFRFRFRNTASYADLSFPTWASNADFWNIDYIKIDSDREKTDTIPSDLAFRARHETLLKNYYAMPWNHFLAASANEMADSISEPYMNYSASLLNVTERLVITDLSGTSPAYNSGLSAANLAAGNDTTFFRNPVPYVFTSGLPGYNAFLVQLCINTATISDPEHYNDTVAFYQRFHNFFAPDDGTAEGGYGLSINGGKAAFQFDFNVPDTIQSVQMFFNRTVNDANQIYFYLTIWDDDGGQPGDIIYEQGGVRPEFEAGLNGFHTYYLDSPLAVNGTVYVGWEQTTDDVLNLGFDRNTNRNDRFFYNVDGTWYNSLYEGTPMIRLIAGSDPDPWAGLPETDPESVVLYPNPGQTGSSVFFSTTEPVLVSVFDLNGKLIHRGVHSGSMDTHGFIPGFYTIRIEQQGLPATHIKWILTE